jgi:hypothetical protein
VEKPERKRPLGRHRHKWEGNIVMDLREVEWSGMDWIILAQGKDRWWVVLKAVINLQVPYKAGNFLSS